LACGGLQAALRLPARSNSQGKYQVLILPLFSRSLVGFAQQFAAPEPQRAARRSASDTKHMAVAGGAWRFAAGAHYHSPLPLALWSTAPTVPG
jgi:hypothetical protein